MLRINRFWYEFDDSLPSSTIWPGQDDVKAGTCTETTDRYRLKWMWVTLPWSWWVKSHKDAIRCSGGAVTAPGRKIGPQPGEGNVWISGQTVSWPLAVLCRCSHTHRHWHRMTAVLVSRDDKALLTLPLSFPRLIFHLNLTHTLCCPFCRLSWQY